MHGIYRFENFLKAPRNVVVARHLARMKKCELFNIVPASAGIAFQSGIELPEQLLGDKIRNSEIEGPSMPLILSGDIRIYYEFEGEGETVVLLGGGLLGRHNFPRVVYSELSKNFRVLSFDQRGYGMSDRPLQKYTMDIWTEDVKNLLDVMGITRAFVVGTSVGGVLALKFASRYPETTIACVSDVPIAKPDAMRKLMFANWRKIAELSGVGELLSDVIITYNVGAKYFEEAGTEKVRQSILGLLSGISVETVVQVCEAMENLDIRDELTKIKVPTLIMGTAGDVVSPLDMEVSGAGGREVARLIPNSKLKIWEGIGHADMIEIPEKSIAYVIEFLKSAEH